MVGFALRAWGSWYGLPFTYFNDEYHEVMRAIALGAGSVDLERFSKGGLYLILFVEYGFIFAVQLVFGQVSGLNDFAGYFINHPTPFYLIGRLTVAAFGTLGILGLYRLANSLYGSRGAIIAASCLCILPMHVSLSRIIGVDVPMVTATIFAFRYMYEVQTLGTTRDLLLAAFFAALAATTKITAILLVIPLGICYLQALKNRAPFSHLTLSDFRPGIYAAVVYVGVLVITNPGVVYLFRLVTLFTNRAEDPTLGQAGEAIITESPNISLWQYYSNLVLMEVGLLFVIALIGIIWLRNYRISKFEVIVLLYCLLHFLAISATSSSLFYPRYALPLLVLALLLAGRPFFAGFSSRERWKNTSIVGLLAVWAAIAGSQVVSASVATVQTDSRTLAYRWLMENVPEGSRIAVEGARVAPKRSTVAIPESRECLVRRAEAWKLIEPDQAIFLEHKASAAKHGGFCLELLVDADVRSLDEYLALGVSGFVLRPDVIGRERELGEFGKQLLLDLRRHPEMRLAASFGFAGNIRLSPMIEIYVRTVRGPTGAELPEK